LNGHFEKPAMPKASASASALMLRPDELISCARLDFWCFVELVFPILHPGDKLVFAEYLEVLASLLMSVQKKNRRRIIINMPPRHLKSMMVSILYVAWRLGRDPTAKFICASYGDPLAHHLSELTRRLMMHPLYQLIFPGTQLEKKAADYLRTTKGGYRYATFVGSDITGFGASEIILDDLLKPDQAASESAKERMHSWVQSSVLTRFNDPRTGVLIVVEHRLASDDLSGTLEATGLYLVLRLPLIAEAEWTCRLDGGRILMHRQPGDLLNERRITAEQAAELRQTFPHHVFQSQYQQRPEAGGSGMLNLSIFPRFDLSAEQSYDFQVHSWDIGATIAGNASVCTKWGLRKENGQYRAYLLDVLRVKLELPEVEAMIKSQNEADGPALIIIDERGVGMGVRQRLNRAGLPVKGSTETSEGLDTRDIPALRPSASKIERFGQAVLVIGDGRVVIPENAPWLEKFLYELAAFPNIADKDQVDSMTQFVANIDVAIRLALHNIGRGLVGRGSDGRRVPQDHERLARAALDQAAPRQLKPHEQRFLLRRGVNLNRWPYKGKERL
jgi:predicted phage terminase large subunit-like protein